jgi:hypothetical protein
MNSIQKAAAKKASEEAANKDAFNSTHEERIVTSIGSMNKNALDIAHFTGSLVKSTADFDGALKALTTSILGAIQAINPKMYAELQHQAAASAGTAGRTASAPGKTKMPTAAQSNAMVDELAGASAAADAAAADYKRSHFIK